MSAPAEQAIPFDRIRAVEWENDHIKLIDQRVLPQRLEYLYVETLPAAAQAIRDMVVRGAPAIGITAAYGVVLGARERYRSEAKTWRERLAKDSELDRKSTRLKSSHMSQSRMPSSA